MFCYKREPNIGSPTNFRHNHSITINPSTGKFHGLPKAWEIILKSQVGFYKELPNLDTILKDGHFCNFLPSDEEPPNTDEKEIKPNTNRKTKTQGEIYGELSRMCCSSDKHNRFEIANTLSKDYAGVVYLACDLHNKKMVTIKEIDMVNKSFRHAPKEFNLNEIKILRNFNDHKNLIQFIESFWMESIHRLWIIVEHMDGGTLTNVIIETVMDERQVAAVTREILNGINYLHSNNVFHRDIRSDNILLGLDGSVKLANFGFSAIIAENNRFNTAVGSPFWMAPEVAAQNYYGVKVDIWSTGITIIEMINGIPPNFELEPLLAMCLIATKGKPKIEGFDTFSDILQDFLNSCLEIDVGRRASAAELLAHSFLKNCAELHTLIPLINYANSVLND